MAYLDVGEPGRTLGYLKKYQPDHVDTALEAFRCFDPYIEDPQSYALSTRLVPSGCEAEAEAASLLSTVHASAAINDIPRVTNASMPNRTP